MTKLLVVDDSEPNRCLLQTLLTRHGYDVILAADGAEALENARENPPDMIITDILMPGMDGYALCHAWKRDEKLKEIPFVFYTSTYTDSKDRQLALDMGAERFIVKPLAQQVFLDTIKELVEEHRDGPHTPPLKPVLEETVYLKEYNAALVRKLGDKVVELESAKRSLERELTGRKEAKEKAERAGHDLLASETRYRRLFESAKDGILILDADTGEIVDVNPFLCELLGFDHGHFLGKKIWEIGLFKDTAASETDFFELQEKGYSRYDDLPLETRDGRSIATEFVSNVYLVDSTRVIQCNIRDITERKQAEEARRQSEERHRTILQTAMDGFWVVDTQGSLLEVNEAYCRMSGYDEQELLAMRIPDLEADETEEIATAHFQKIIAQGEDRFESRHRRKDGTILHVEVGVEHKTAEGGRFVAFLHDITERKRQEDKKAKLEAQLQQAQKMESVGRLAGGVAHDFNNMLAVILGYTEVALDQLSPDQPLHADLEEVHKAGKRAADLTRQLLAFARKQTILPKVLDLNDTVAGMLKMLQRLIGEDLCLTWQPGANLWLIKVDPSQIDQILANLCVNARDAIADVGRITIETENRTVDEHYCAGHAGFVPGEYVQLTVSDSGCGIEKEMLAQIFEPFFTTKEMGKGTGLGLATIYGIVKQNNGFINVYSEVGQGTVFTVYLPRYVGEGEQTVAQNTASANQRGNETILLVEDELPVLKLTAKLLRELGYTVLAAPTPGEAIHLAREYTGEIHLLMTDVVMPEMNGRDLAQNLLSLYPKIKRLFMSGYTADVIARQGVLDEGTHFIQKPFSIQDMAAKVREALGSE